MLWQAIDGDGDGDDDGNGTVKHEIVTQHQLFTITTLNVEHSIEIYSFSSKG